MTRSKSVRVGLAWRVPVAIGPLAGNTAPDSNVGTLFSNTARRLFETNTSMDRRSKRKRTTFAFTSSGRSSEGGKILTFLGRTIAVPHAVFQSTDWKSNDRSWIIERGNRVAGARRLFSATLETAHTARNPRLNITALCQNASARRVVDRAAEDISNRSVRDTN